MNGKPLNVKVGDYKTKDGKEAKVEFIGLFGQEEKAIGWACWGPANFQAIVHWNLRGEAISVSDGPEPESESWDLDLREGDITLINSWLGKRLVDKRLTKGEIVTGVRFSDYGEIRLRLGNIWKDLDRVESEYDCLDEEEIEED